MSKTNIRQHQQALETKQSKFNEADLNERMAKPTHETSNCNLPIVSFNEERVAVCDCETPQTERCVLSGIKFCMKCIRPLSQTES